MNKSQKNIALELLFLSSPAALQAEAQTAFERPPWAGFFAKCLITLKTIYLDQGNEKKLVRYHALSNLDKTAATITKTSSGRWVSKSSTMADEAFANKGPLESDFSLVSEDDEDDVFHMVEITK